MFNNLPLYKIIPLPNNNIEIALVDEPAIDEYFHFFSKENEIITFNSDKMIIEGVVMIPNIPIIRNNPFPHYVVYDADSIKECAKLFFKNSTKFNIKHGDIKAEVNLLESYFTKNDEKYPDGSWYVVCKVEDTALWNKIKEGEYKGFSFQSLFVTELINDKFNMTKKEQLLDFVNKVLFNEEPVSTEPISTENEIPKPDYGVKVEEMELKLTSLMDKITDIETKLSSIADNLVKLEEMVKANNTDINSKIEEFSKQEVTKPVVDKPHLAFI